MNNIGPIKRFIFNLNNIDSAKVLMAVCCWFSHIANDSNHEIYSHSLLAYDLIEKYDMAYFHSDRFKDYVWEICNPSKLISVADLPVKIDPEKVIFEFINHQRLSEILTDIEFGYLKEILNENNVEIIWN